jgi:diguanylate cyclase (GGDEF)-like protein
MSLAVIALGALAVWAAIVTQNGAQELSRAGIQTSGHLRAIQALSQIDSSVDALEERRVPGEVANVRAAQAILDESIERMAGGGVAETRSVATRSEPIVRRLTPAVEEFLTGPPVSNKPGASGLENDIEDILGELQVVLNDLDSDPSEALTTQLDSVTSSERTVRGVALVLVPLGLAGVGMCGWLLTVYRRRSEAMMRSAVDTSAHEARTDELTGLPNRRALLEELEERTEQGASFTLTLADLNGFKRYNDTFGHPAGDALLRRLGRKLATACEGSGTAARLGGDEFCVLFADERTAEEAHAATVGALCDEGEGFRITAAAGVVSIPEDTGDPVAALRLADSRMYASKVGAHPSPEQAMSDALTLMLNEHAPGLANHVEEVTQLAVDCAETLGLSAEDIQMVERTAQLHDLGKVAIPSEILGKNGPLSEDEWEFMTRHSLIGERILGGVPALTDIASMVRSSHERWDGAGYPDGLAGVEIPIGARVTFVADAYCAMTEDRPYAKARTLASARRELRDCAGTQFDPTVVAAFLDVLDRREAEHSAPASPVPVVG